MRITCVCNEKCFINQLHIYVEKVKDVECKEESKDVQHSGFRTDNKSTNESEMSTFSGSTSIRQLTLIGNLNCKQGIVIEKATCKEQNKIEHNEEILSEIHNRIMKETWSVIPNLSYDIAIVKECAFPWAYIINYYNLPYLLITAVVQYMIFLISIHQS